MIFSLSLLRNIGRVISIFKTRSVKSYLSQKNEDIKYLKKLKKEQFLL